MRLAIPVLYLSFSISCWAAADLNPPPPTPREGAGKEQSQSQRTTQQGKEEVGKSFSPIPVKEAASGGEHTAQANKKHEDEKSNNEALIAWGTVALAVFTLFLFIATYRLYRVTASLAFDAKTSADRQFDSLVSAERGYAKITHSPPGVQIQEPRGSTGFLVSFEIKNWGKSPIHITDVRFGCHALEYEEKLQIPFEFNDQHREVFHNGFLVPGEAMTINRKPFPFIGPKAKEVLSSKRRLWVFANVYYTDVFKRRWVSGWARHYEPILDNGLVDNLARITTDHYEFDRERTEDDESK